MSLLEIITGSFDFWILINILSILFAVFICVRSFLAMRYDDKMVRLQHIRTNQRRRHEHSQPTSKQGSLTIALPESASPPPKEQYMNGNDLRVVAKSLLKKTKAQQISQNIGET